MPQRRVVVGAIVLLALFLCLGGDFVLAQENGGGVPYCFLPATIAQESLYVTALSTVTSYAFAPTGLQLHDDANRMVLQYRALCGVPNYLDQTIC
jgi:hypothetical protein